MKLIHTGICYYLEIDSHTVPITRAQYRVLCDLDDGKIDASQIASRHEYYRHQQEQIRCCEKGYLPREVVEMLRELDDDGHIHRSLSHTT